LLRSNFKTLLASLDSCLRPVSAGQVRTAPGEDFLLLFSARALADFLVFRLDFYRGASDRLGVSACVLSSACCQCASVWLPPDEFQPASVCKAEIFPLSYRAPQSSLRSCCVLPLARALPELSFAAVAAEFQSCPLLVISSLPPRLVPNKSSCRRFEESDFCCVFVASRAVDLIL
jgi:hypothetical protein